MKYDYFEIVGSIFSGMGGIAVIYIVGVWILYRCSIVDESRFVKAAYHFFLFLSISVLLIGGVATYLEFQNGRVLTGVGIHLLWVGGYILFHTLKGDWLSKQR